MSKCMGQIMAECDCQHRACEVREYCMAERIQELEAKLVAQQHTLDSTEAMVKEYRYRAITAEANSDKAFALEDALKLEPIRAALAILQQMAFELNRELFGEPPDSEPEMREMLAKINSAFADLHVRKQ
jgi:uncharacterized coiled-coil protein SlyX